MATTKASKAKVPGGRRRAITKRGLLPQEELFCTQYVAHRFNGKQSAIAAGYAEGSAEGTASRLLSRAQVQARIAGLIDLGLKKATRTADEVLAGLCTLAFSDLGDFMTWDENGTVTFADTSKADPQLRRTLESCTIADTQFGRRITLKMHDKLGALTLLAKHHNLVREHVAHENPDGTAITGAVLVLPDNGRTALGGTAVYYKPEAPDASRGRPSARPDKA